MCYFPICGITGSICYVITLINLTYFLWYAFRSSPIYISPLPQEDRPFNLSPIILMDYNTCLDNKENRHSSKYPFKITSHSRFLCPRTPSPPMSDIKTALLVEILHFLYSNTCTAKPNTIAGLVRYLFIDYFHAGKLNPAMP